MTASAPIDDFLSGGSSVAAGERLEAIGGGLALGGTLLAVGLVVLLATVHHGPRREVRWLLRGAGGAGLLVLVGGAVEIAGTARILDVGWSTALTDGEAASGMMRLLAGLLVVLGLAAETVPVAAGAADPDGTTDGSAGGDADGDVRWTVSAGSAYGFAGLALAVVSFSFDGHTVTEGPRVVHALVDIAHVGAGGVWFGGMVGLAALGLMRRRAGGTVAPLLVRFSAIATVALAVVVAAGVAMSWMILDGPGELTGTTWGRRLSVKVVAVALAAAFGAYHHFAVVPRRVSRDGPDREPSARTARALRTTMVVEAAVLVVVVVLSALLVRASTVGG